jgi:sulfate transport system substrate-binding protein
VPYRSTIVFLVRQGNPKHLQNWDDLVRSGVSLVVPNPKTSEVGKYSYLAAWGYASRRPGADKSAAVRFVGDLFAHAPVLDPNARGAATTFAERGIGDALLVLESDAARLQRDFPAAGFEIEVPAESILAEDVVAWVDRNVERHHTENLARAYLQFLYSPAGQELAAKDFLRPENKAVLAKYAGQFKPIALFTVQDVAGGWEKAQQDHFSDGGIFDQIRQRN